MIAASRASRLRRVALALASLLLGATLVPLTATPAAAATSYGVQLGDFEFSVDTVAQTATVFSWTGSGGAVTIPAQVEFQGTSYPVTAIGDKAFDLLAPYTTWPDFRRSMTSVSIPDSVTSIGVAAFQYNSQLSAVTLPAGLVTIGAYAFSLTGIHSIAFPASVTTIGDHAFEGSLLRGTVTVPSTVTSFGDYVFTNNRGITGLSYPSGWTRIPAGFIKGTSIQSFTIPSTITDIGADAFSNVPVTSLVLPDGLRTIGSSAFLGSYGLTSVSFPDSLETIGDSAFYAVCPTSITFGSRLQSIGKWAFDCPLGIGVVVGNGIPSSVTIPGSVSYIGPGAFANMNGAVPQVTFLGDQPAGDAASWFGGSGTHVTYCTGVNGFTTPTWNGSQTTPVSCTLVSYDANDGTGRTAHQSSSSATRILQNPFTPSACNSFTEWIQDGGQILSTDAVLPFTAATTLHAQWQAGTVALVTYNLNDGTGATSGGGGYCNTLLTEPTPPVRAGYTFGGWFTDAALTTQWNFATDLLGPIHYQFYAKWTPSTTYAISYAGLAGAANGTNPTSYTIADTVSIVAPGARTGYDFLGWTAGASTIPSPVVGLGPGATGDLALTANWAPIDYAITTDLAGGTAGAPANPASYTIESAPISLTAPSRTGYDFAGWTGTGITGSSVSVTIPTGSTGDRSYTAGWTPVDYTIGIDLAGGTAGAPANPASYMIESSAIALSAPSRAGYDFAGWSGTGIGNGTTDLASSVTIAAGSTGDRAFTAHWTIQSYAVSFDSSGGTPTSIAPQSVAYGGVATEPVAPTRVGFAFGGWLRFASPYDFAAPVTGPVDLVAKWNPAAATASPAGDGPWHVTADASGGFLPGETVDVVIHSTPFLLGTLVAGPDGSVHGSFTVPASIGAGAHTLVLTGATSGWSLSQAVTLSGLAATGVDPSPAALLAALLLLVGLSLGRLHRRREAGR